MDREECYCDAPNTEECRCDMQKSYNNHKKAIEFPIDVAKRRAWIDKFHERTSIVSLMGMFVDISDDRVVRVNLPKIEPMHCGGMGVHRDGTGGGSVNGLVVTGMLECAIGVAGVLQFPDQRAGVVQLSVDLLSAAYGSSIFAEAFVVRRARHLCFCEARLYNAHKKLCAMASGIVAHA